MATIDLGKIKMVWRGPYDNSTAYTPDDVVSSGGSSYICILASTGNAVSNATYWQQMAGKGTDADLLNIASTAQGDIYYNNGSAIARLAPGTANQVLKTGGAGANPSWGTLSSDFVRIVTASGDGTAVLDLDSCFSTNYENYMIFSNIHVSTSTGVYIRLQNSSNTEISSGYYWAGTQNYRNSSTGGGDTKSGWNTNQWEPHESVAAETEGYVQLNLKVSRPMIDNRYTLMQIDYHSYDGSTFRSVQSHCSQRDAIQMAGIRFFVNSGNITSSSSVSVYGIKNS